MIDKKKLKKFTNFIIDNKEKFKDTRIFINEFHYIINSIENKKKITKKDKKKFNFIEWMSLKNNYIKTQWTYYKKINKDIIFL
jgi:hypothetical protein